MPSFMKPQLPKGMRDFLPGDMLRRQYVTDTVTDVFETFGFEPIQTPVLEMYDTLMGKYGEDAENLIFTAQHAEGKSELALRYDLTVPLTRFFSMHENELPLPFKRYHIAPVWRAERPQRGRYREFYQCDADIIGIPGMEADAEVLSVTATAIERLGFHDFVIKINNRKLLTGIGQYAGLSGDALNSLYRTMAEASLVGGWMFFAYSAAQFIFGPLLGNLSDRFGRRPLLLLAILGLALDYLLQALAPNLLWLYVGRAISGVCGASWIIANAYIADITAPEERAKYFGLLGAAFGLGFVLGPAIGGILANR